MVLCIAVPVAGCHKEKPPPSIDGLSDALERAAQQKLAAPPLANEQVMLAAQPGGIDAQADEVLHAAALAGGAAIRSAPSAGAPATVSILATIPENNAVAFKSALRHVKTAMVPPSASTLLIEVLIQPAAPSPTP